MKSQKFGLIGNSLTHSFSKGFFETRYKVENPFLSFENIPLPTIDALELWFAEESNNYTGVNVTIPYKTAVIPFLDELSEEAKTIGAVNTISFVNGRKIGYNTDAFGFQQSIKPFLRNIHEKALILGTGGAAKAVSYVLKNLGITVCFLSRNFKEGATDHFSYTQANENMVNTFKLIVNCTPIGMFPKEDEQLNFPINYVGNDHLVVDLIYNPDETKFLKIARENGADTLNGMTMLQQQAIKSWEIWNRK